MKSFGLGLIAASAIALGVSQSASAADLGRAPVYKSPVMAPFSWTGLYLGVHIGGAWANDNWSQIGNAASFDSSGFIGGGQIGYNWQFAPNWVLGVEADVSGSTQSGSGIQTRAGWSSATDINAFGTVTGRLGYAIDRTLIYFKGGFVWADETVKQSFGGVQVASAGFNPTGWTIGGGVEWAFWDNWSAKVEYNYYDLGTNGFSFANLAPAPVAFDAFNNNQTMHVIKAGLNYRFNWARY